MQPLFDIQESILPVRRGEKIMSLSFDERQIIRWIMLLYNNGEAFELDPTYSVGRFWHGLPKPRLKMDISPQVDGVIQANVLSLPLANESVGSIMFDPPFMVAPSTRPGKMRDRFSCYHRDAPALLRFYRSAIIELWRVLRYGGVLVFKCQDAVNGGINYMIHAIVMAMAQRAGFYCEDLFILARQNVMWSPNMVNQKHARKNHTYFLVFRKVRDGTRYAKADIAPFLGDK